MEKYKYKGVHKKFKVKGELHHFISDELFCGELLSSYYEGLSDGESNQIKRITDEELAGLGLVRKEKLDVAVKALKDAREDLRHYQLMSNEEWDSTNAWETALSGIKRIEECLKEIEEK